METSPVFILEHVFAPLAYFYNLLTQITCFCASVWRFFVKEWFCKITISSQGAWDLDILPVPCDISQWFVMLSTLQQNWNKAGCDSISNSTASLNNVDDEQADEPANIPEDTDSDKELEKEQQEWRESGEPISKKARAKPRVVFWTSTCALRR